MIVSAPQQAIFYLTLTNVFRGKRSFLVVLFNFQQQLEQDKLIIFKCFEQ